MRHVLGGLSRRLCTGTPVKPHVCIVGAGPAGFYAAQHLAKHLPGAQVDIYEQLPVPFGLVRFGVAPDHPEVKNVINTFTKTAGNPSVRFLGNVNVGKDITLKQLKEAYHAVLLTYGADENRKLEIPGENLTNIISAKSLVGWYNGVPWDRDLKVDLSGSSAAVFGQGNVAVDVARILLTPIDVLKATDITQHALDQLAASKIKTVHLIGRRGPLQAAFTIKELREMLKLSKCATHWNREDFHGVLDIIPSLARPKKRITELMLKSASEAPKGANHFKVVFFRSPLEFLGSGNLAGVKLAINSLEGADFLTQRAVATGEIESLECQLGITSIGYKSMQIDADIPFDHARGLAVNTNFKVSRGVYASGWVATGPTGVILTTMSNAFATADIMVKDFSADGLLKEGKPGFAGIEGILGQANVQLVEWKDWLKIDKYEQEEGAKVGKPREKIIDVGKMLEVAS